MSIEMIKSEIRYFLTEEDRLALCLNGKWGTGKTHTWKTLLIEAFKNENVSPSKYAYVSLFGLESLGDVRRSLFENTKGSTAFKNTEPFEATTSGILKKLPFLVSKWREWVGAVTRKTPIKIPLIADYSSLVELGFLSVQDQIVCFDDLERMSENLALKDVLGLISFLKEERRCKVVLLLNSEVLEGQNTKDFKNQLEKVIDINLVFSPTAQEAAEIAISDTAIASHEWVKECVVKLEISNIRTIFKLLRIVDRLEKILDGYDKRILKRAIHSACLYGFALYQPRDAPSVKYILNQPSEVYSLLSRGTKEKNPRKIRWSRLLKEYEYHGPNALDIAIFDSIRTGVYDEAKIKEKAQTLFQQLSLDDQYTSFKEIWKIYHDSFDDNADEFTTKLKKSILDCAAVISPSDLSGSIEALKLLGYKGDVKSLIQGYIEKRNDGKEFWLSGASMKDPDPDVAEAFAKKAAEFCDDLKLQDVLTDIARSKKCSKEVFESIDKHSVDDFYEMLKSTKGEALYLAIEGLIIANDTMQSIREKAISVFQWIERESKINHLRAKTKFFDKL
ncbi:hypothetical protein [Candidatus Nitrosacidococcus tergens]|uniref:KAP NTPase domain-containing protein n=1 Tax=Candidatus Nitrosacidococcus tergens TaxID=553981 RepID=A0A7G1QBL5_9GAMM|nr:hypothetical protein [Candidatus Nitrosacidococcus tergens]CAB1277372.1 conserved protein of unknown function [Candidatus Nitrosacidococcus tergens]